MTPQPDVMPARARGAPSRGPARDHHRRRQRHWAAVAIAFAREGADVAIAYLEEHEDAEQTRRLVTAEGGLCLLLPGDIADADHCRAVVGSVVREWDALDILVNNAAEQHPVAGLEEIDDDQLVRTFASNVFSMFFMTRAALAHLGEGAAVINSASVTAYKGNPRLIDYSATKGAIISFTRALAANLAAAGSGSRGRPGSGLDAADRGLVRGRGGRRVRHEGAARPRCPTGRDRAQLCVSRVV